jgi:hypothetical protein
MQPTSLSRKWSISISAMRRALEDAGIELLNGKKPG